MPAVDTFMVADPFYIHLTFAHTEPAAVAPAVIDLHSCDRKLTEHPVQRAQRTKETAEGSVAEHTGQPDHKHYHKLSSKQNA